MLTANSAISLFEVGGFIGSLVAGWGSDKWFRGNRGPMNLIFAIGIFLSVASLWTLPSISFVLQAGCFFAIGFFIFGPQMLIGMAAAECSHKDAAGAATGFVGLFAYLGRLYRVTLSLASWKSGIGMVSLWLSLWRHVYLLSSYCHSCGRNRRS